MGCMAGRDASSQQCLVGCMGVSLCCFVCAVVLSVPFGAALSASCDGSPSKKAALLWLTLFPVICMGDLPGWLAGLLTRGCAVAG